MRRNAYKAMIAAAALTLSTGTAPRAQGAPIDCSIILCLAGGWPASAECARAKAEFIRRITPYPIEPPVQVWNCPMKANSSPAQRSVPLDWLVWASEVRAESRSTDFSAEVIQVQQADIDISDSAFDVIRSIRVWDVQYSHRERGKDEECSEEGTVILGTYGPQGDYKLTGVKYDDVPDWILPQRTCEPETWTRAVGIEWRDGLGNYGSELVHY